MERAGTEIVLPPVSVPHLIDWLMEVGPVDVGADRAPIGWPTIRAWSILSRIVPAPWEARLLRRLSAEWLAESRRAEKPDCPEPSLDGAAIVNRRDFINRKLAALFG